jgi:hypothetical protein
MLVGRVVVYDEMCVEIGRDHGVDVLQEVQELLVAMTLSALCDRLIVRDVERGEQSRRPVPDIVVGDAFRVAQPEGQDRLRPSSAWIWVFSSTHNTTALSGGFRYSPTMSRTLSTKAGSVESLKLFERCGCTPKSDSIRATVLFERPVSEAAERTVQFVPSVGFFCRTVRSRPATRSCRRFSAGQNELRRRGPQDPARTTSSASDRRSDC